MSTVEARWQAWKKTYAQRPHVDGVIEADDLLRDFFFAGAAAVLAIYEAQMQSVFEGSRIELMQWNHEMQNRKPVPLPPAEGQS